MEAKVGGSSPLFPPTMKFTAMFQIEFILTKLINNISFGGDFLNSFFLFISNTFGKFPIVILVGLLLAAYLIYKVIKLDSNSRALKSAIIEFARFTFIVGTSSIFTEILKKVISRGRPFSYSDSIILREIVDQSDVYQSFPSGHTVVVFSITWFLILGDYPKLIKVLALLISILVAISRIYLGVHFISDILASIIISFVFAKFVGYFTNIAKNIWIQ